MKYFWSFFNIAVIAIVIVAMGQTIPTLISSNDWSKFSTGVLLLLISLAFVWTRIVEFYNEVRK